MQERIAGILLITIGLMLSAKPMLVWKITESWKTKDQSGPSKAYLTVLRIVSGAFVGVGVLLASGILQ